MILFGMTLELPNQSYQAKVQKQSATVISRWGYSNSTNYWRKWVKRKLIWYHCLNYHLPRKHTRGQPMQESLTVLLIWVRRLFLYCRLNPRIKLRGTTQQLFLALHNHAISRSTLHCSSCHSLVLPCVLNNSWVVCLFFFFFSFFGIFTNAHPWERLSVTKSAEKLRFRCALHCRAISCMIWWLWIISRSQIRLISEWNLVSHMHEVNFDLWILSLEIV